MTAVLERERRLAEFDTSRVAYMRAYRWWVRLGLEEQAPNRPGRDGRGPGSRALLTPRQLLAIATAQVVSQVHVHSCGETSPTDAGERAALAVMATEGRYLFACPTLAVVADSWEQLLDLWHALGDPAGSFVDLALVPCPAPHPIGDPR